MSKILIFILTLLAASLFSQEAADTIILRDKLISLQKELSEVKQKTQDEKIRFQKYEKRIKKVLMSRKNELKKIEKELNELKEKNEEVNTSLYSFERRSKEIDNRFKNYKNIIIDYANVLKEHIKQDFPASIEQRTSTLDLLIRDVQTADISAEEAFGRLWVIMDNEMRFGNSIDVRKKEIVLESGVSASVNELRIGKQALMYASVDNKHFGIIKKNIYNDKTEYEWVTDGLDYAARTAIKEAIAVKTGKKAPKLVEIPIYTSQIKGGKK